MSNEPSIPKEWKFATLQADGSYCIECRIREPGKIGTYFTVINSAHECYEKVKRFGENSPVGMRFSLGPSIEELTREIKEEENSPEYKAKLKANAAVIKKLKEEFPDLFKSEKYNNLDD